MRKLSLQWRITLMTALLICATCVLMNFLIGYSGKHYMDAISDGISTFTDDSAANDSSDEADAKVGGTSAGTGAADSDIASSNDNSMESFNPDDVDLDSELTIIVGGAQESFDKTNWYITIIVTLLGGILAYFVSGRALKPLRTFAAQVEKVQPNNLADMKISEDVLPEFKQFSMAFNNMIERLDEGFYTQRQFTGNAAHELRTPLALMQAHIELFTAEHPVVGSETSEILKLLQEQTERMSSMTKTLLEMSELREVPCDDEIELAPMIEEIFTDLAPLAEKKGVALECDGDATITGSDTLIYQLIFNLTENALRYNREGGKVRITVDGGFDNVTHIRVCDHGFGIPEQYRESIFQPFFRVDKSRSRKYGGVGLGLALVWEIVNLHGGTIEVEDSSENGTTMLVTMPAQSEK